MAEPTPSDKAKNLPVGCAVVAVALTVLLLFGAALVIRSANAHPGGTSTPGPSTGNAGP